MKLKLLDITRRSARIFLNKNAGYCTRFYCNVEGTGDAKKFV